MNLLRTETHWGGSCRRSLSGDVSWRAPYPRCIVIVASTGINFDLPAGTRGALAPSSELPWGGVELIIRRAVESAGNINVRTNGGGTTLATLTGASPCVRLRLYDDTVDGSSTQWGVKTFA